MGLVLATSLSPAPPDLSDLDQDGYPDVAEFHSTAQREAFLAWFAAIAEAQFTAPSPAWPAEAQDCSGLLRFAFVEALKPKTPDWFQKFPYLPKVQAPPLGTFPLPQIGRAVFRVAPGPYRPDDVREGRLVGWTSAMYLMWYSSVPLGRTPDKAWPKARPTTAWSTWGTAWWSTTPATPPRKAGRCGW
jgi:uncharacterized protein YfaT (DUF1175 family)